MKGVLKYFNLLSHNIQAKKKLDSLGFFLELFGRVLFSCFILCNNYKFKGSKWRYTSTWKFCWTIWYTKLFVCFETDTVQNEVINSSFKHAMLLSGEFEILQSVGQPQGQVMSQLMIVWQLFSNSSRLFSVWVAWFQWATSNPVSHHGCDTKGDMQK